MLRISNIIVRFRVIVHMQCQLVKRTIAGCCLSWGGRRRQLLYPTKPRSRSEKSAAVLSSKRPR